MLPDEMRRLKALEDENSRLNKIAADLTLEPETLPAVAAGLSCARNDELLHWNFKPSS